MWQTGRISIPDFRQKNEANLKIIEDFTKEWNDRKKDVPLNRDFGGWNLFLTKTTFHEYPIIVKELNDLKNKENIYFTHTNEKHYEESDYLAADFTEFSSWEIEANTPFVINRKEIAPSGGHCSKCGAWYALEHQSEPPPIIINEDLLKCPMEELTKPDDEEWDLVHTYTHYIISSRFKKILGENDINGYTLRPVISHSTGEASEKMFQILAHKSIFITALPEGETVQPFCDTCGSARIPYEHDFAIRKEWIGGDDFFARNTYKGDRLHMSNRVFKLMREHRLTGLWPQATVAVV